MKVTWPPIVRNIGANELLENFVLFSVLSIVGIRIFLRSTNYPQLGMGELHIAHMLWGGLFMTVALLLLFLFLNKTAQRIASVLAGIGFGMFIDELGKFITADNDYFYRPSVAIIYIILVMVYLVSVVARRWSNFSTIEYLTNALEATKEVVIQDFDKEEKRKVLVWLAKSKKQDPLAQSLTKVVREVKPIAITPSLLSRIRKTVTVNYRQLVATKLVFALGIGFVVGQIISYAMMMTLFIMFRRVLFGFIGEYDWGFFSGGLLLSIVLAMTLAAVGLFYLLKVSRRRAYWFFRLSMLANILLVTFFIFYFNQLIALVNFVINYTFLKAFEAAQVQETKLQSVPK